MSLKNIRLYILEVHRTMLKWILTCYCNIYIPMFYHSNSFFLFNLMRTVKNPAIEERLLANSIKLIELSSQIWVFDWSNWGRFKYWNTKYNFKWNQSWILAASQTYSSNLCLADLPRKLIGKQNNSIEMYFDNYFF